MNITSITKILIILLVGIEHINALSNNLRKRKTTATTQLLIDTLSSILGKDDWTCCDETNEPTPVPTVTVDIPTSSSTSPTLYVIPTSILTKNPTESPTESPLSITREHTSIIIIMLDYNYVRVFSRDGTYESTLTCDDCEDHDFGSAVTTLEDKIVTTGRMIVRGCTTQILHLSRNLVMIIDDVYFGFNVAITNNHVVVAAPDDDDNDHTDSGSVLI